MMEGKIQFVDTEAPVEIREFLQEHSIKMNEDESLDVEQVIQADRIMWKLGKMSDEIETLNDAMEEAQQFYQDKIENIKKNIRILEYGMETHIIASGEKTIQVPNGTMRLRKRVKPIYPEDTVLISWSNSMGIKTRVNESPDRTAIQNYIKETGDIPEGYEEEEVVGFTYTLNK